jgi:hypothetical protein
MDGSTQDTHVIQVPFMDNESSGFFAVYDGHGGKEAADLASEELHKFLEAELGKQGQPVKVMTTRAKLSARRGVPLLTKRRVCPLSCCLIILRVCFCNQVRACPSRFPPA